MATTVFIADDHTFSLLGIKTHVQELGYTVVDTSSNGIIALNLINLHLPQICILDISMPGMNGLEILKEINNSGIPTRVILLTMHKEWSIYQQARELGVAGFILKDYAEKELSICLQRVLSGETYVSPVLTDDLIIDQTENQKGLSLLTTQEQKVLSYISQQKTNKQIAELLFVGEKAIEKTRKNIIIKLGLPNEKNALLRYALGNS